MAVRIHVVGARGGSQEELRRALDSIGEEGRGSQRFRIGTSNDWQWAHASVWHVAGSDIDRALGQLAVPTFRVTTSDASLWTLTLQAPGKEPFRGVHHFTAVGREPEVIADAGATFDPDFPDDELDEVAGIHRFIPELEFLWDAEEEARLRALMTAEAEATVPGLEDYTAYDVSLPPQTIEAMRNNPARAWYLALQAHSRQIVAQLEEFGFEFDRAALLAMLTTGPLTPREQDADVGNLPRFLEQLGVIGVFAESPEEASSEVDTDEEETGEPDDEPMELELSDHPPGKLRRRFDQLLPQCGLSEIAGGTVDVPQLAVLHLLSHLLCEQPDVCLTVRVPSASYKPERQWEEMEALEVVHQGELYRFFCKTPHFFWSLAAEPEHLHENSLSQAVRNLPPGTRWELTMLVDGLSEKCHRYAGLYTGGRWIIEKSYPPLTAGQLSDALLLVGGVFDHQRPIALLSDDETAAVRRSYLRAHDEPAPIRHGKIKAEYGTGLTVVQAILFERYKNSGPWDVRAAQDLVEQGWQEFADTIGGDDDFQDEDDEDSSSLSDEDAVRLEEANARLKQMQESLEALQRSKVVPHRDTVVYRGQTGAFWQADLGDLEHLTADMLAEQDAQMSRLGMSAIGDFAGDVDQRQSISRCYAGDPRAVALISHRKADNTMGWADMGRELVSVDFSQGAVEFHTDFADGTCLTTASVDGARSKPELGIYVRCYEEIPLAQLWEKHLDGIQRFHTHRGTQHLDHVALTKPSAYLARMDRLFARLLAQNAD